MKIKRNALTMYLIFSSLFLFCYCSNTPENKNSEENNTKSLSSNKEDDERMVKFRVFISKFKQFSFPFDINTKCYSPNLEEYNMLDMGNDSIFLNGYVGPGVAIGLFPDTSNTISVIYCVAAECYMPYITTYSKDGYIIDSKQILFGGEYSPGYELTEKLIVNSSTDITVVTEESNFETDSIGKEIANSRKTETKICKYCIEIDGKINVKYK
jgi:hypothetical protein